MSEKDEKIINEVKRCFEDKTFFDRIRSGFFLVTDVMDRTDLTYQQARKAINRLCETGYFIKGSRTKKGQLYLKPCINEKKHKRILGAYHREEDVYDMIEFLCDKMNATIPKEKFQECVDYIFDYFDRLSLGMVYEIYKDYIIEAFEEYLIERDVK